MGNGALSGGTLVFSLGFFDFPDLPFTSDFFSLRYFCWSACVFFFSLVTGRMIWGASSGERSWVRSWDFFFRDGVHGCGVVAGDFFRILMRGPLFVVLGCLMACTFAMRKFLILRQVAGPSPAFLPYQAMVFCLFVSWSLVPGRHAVFPKWLPAIFIFAIFRSFLSLPEGFWAGMVWPGPPHQFSQLLPPAMEEDLSFPEGGKTLVRLLEEHEVGTTGHSEILLLCLFFRHRDAPALRESSRPAQVHVFSQGPVPCLPSERLFHGACLRCRQGRASDRSSFTNKSPSWHS